MPYILYGIGLLCFVFALVRFRNGFELLSNKKSDAKFTLILVFIPITFDTSTKLIGYYSIAKGLLFIAFGVIMFIFAQGGK